MEKEVTYVKDGGDKRGRDSVKEEVAAYQFRERKQGEYTLEDYYAIPEDRRVELIDGVIYDMAAPNLIHQQIQIRVATKLMNFIDRRKGKCMVFQAPTDVQLDRDNRTMIQPDVFVQCNREQLLKHCHYGEPELIVEILSPSTRKLDMILKLNKYRNAGVKEYWMIDPEEKRVIVYEFKKDAQPVIYGAESSVPVGIWGGECKVDFASIFKEIEFLYGR